MVRNINADVLNFKPKKHFGGLTITIYWTSAKQPKSLNARTCRTLYLLLETLTPPLPPKNSDSLDVYWNFTSAALALVMWTLIGKKITRWWKRLFHSLPPRVRSGAQDRGHHRSSIRAPRWRISESRIETRGPRRTHLEIGPLRCAGPYLGLPRLPHRRHPTRWPRTPRRW